MNKIDYLRGVENENSKSNKNSGTNFFECNIC